MTGRDVESLKAFCNAQLHTHTDWTGTRVETKRECESVDRFTDNLVNFINACATWKDSDLKVAADLIKQVCKYCEDNAIYDKLGNYGDFYYKFKKLLEE